MVVIKIDPPEESADGNGSSETPPSDLFIDRFEVTDGEYAAFLAATRYQPAEATLFLDHWQGRAGERPKPREPDTPVRWVSLEDARAFALFHSKELPTRDEWLAACPSITSGLPPWSGRVRAGACNSWVSRLEAPTPVGMYQLGRTPSGCYDMVGNVAEWTTSDANGPEKRWIMGGSFATPCDASGLGRAGEARTPGATFARSEEEREALMEPWLDRLHPEERRSDVGFRCVVRDAAKVVEESLDAAGALAPDDRTVALAELARAGVWPSSSENRLDPFVHDILLRRRRRFALAADGKRRDPLHVARCDVTRVDGARRGGGDDLLLIGDDAVTLLDGRDGSIAFERPVPGCGDHPRHGILAGRDGVARAWVEGPGGSIALVDWRGGRSESVSELRAGHAADAPVPTTWCASDPRRRGDAWFVQAFDAESGESRVVRPCTRVVRVGADGVHERLLAGSPPGAPRVAPARASDDGLFLPLEHPLEVALPIGRRVGRWIENLEHVSALRLGADLKTTGVAWVADGRVRLPPIPRSVPKEVGVERRWDEIRYRRFVASGSVSIDAPTGSFQWLLPTELAATYLVRDGSGRLLLWSGGREDSLLPRPLQAPPRGEWSVLPSEGDCLEPLVVSRESRELREITGGSLAPRVRDLDWSDDAVFSALVPAPDRMLIVHTRTDDWFGVAVDEPSRRFALSLGRATIGALVTQLPSGRAALSAQSTPFEAWVRDADRFELLDEAGVLRPPLEQFIVADLDGAGRFDPVLLFHDGSLVALRPPEPRMARLAEEWRLAASGAQPGEARTDAGR
jgi:sulfatase-modifying factor enzyme 1